jgi:alkylation response protein AidB-like acyl-CoA dehydrogenase
VIEPFSFAPLTPEGAVYLERIREIQPELTEHARICDRSGDFAEANVRLLQRSGVLAGPVPIELGGLGVASPHDLAAGSFEIARACSSTAIASWMHIGTTFGLAGPWRALVARGRRDAVAGVEETLRSIARGERIFCVAATEPGVYLGQAINTVAERVDEGWVINGLKTFATMSPIATTLNVPLKIVVDGTAHSGRALISRDLPGVGIPNDWDGMGMRGSESGAIRLNNVRLPTDAVTVGKLLGSEDPEQHYNWLSVGSGLTSSAIGIAQAARDRAIEQLKTRVKAPAPHPVAERVAIQLAVAELDTELFAAKSMQRTHMMDVDRLYAEYSPRSAQLEDLRVFLAASYATKHYVEQAAIRIVNKAMDLAGGGSYVTSSDFGRWYRDVRALPFMAPSATEMTQIIGQVSLGLAPRIDY